MKGTTYALWDRVEKEFVCWSIRNFKEARAEMLGFINHRVISVLLVQDNTVQYEVNREVGKRTSKPQVNIKHAQSKLY